MGGNFDKFVLLLWKNWKLQYRRPFRTALEILAPIIFTALLIIVRSLVDPKEHETINYKPFSTMPMQMNFGAANIANITPIMKQFSLAYSPSSNVVLDRSMDFFKRMFINVRNFKTAKDLEEHFLDSSSHNKSFAGIQFSDDLHELKTLPEHLQVTIRFPAELRAAETNFLFGDQTVDGNKTKKGFAEKATDIFELKSWKTNLIYPLYQTLGPRSPKINSGGPPSYYSEGFLTLQTLLTYFLAFGRLNLNSDGESFRKLLEFPHLIRLQRFPHASWIHDPLLPALTTFSGMIVMLSFVYPCINTVRVITNEKEKQLKEAMKIMGLSNWLHWTAWFTQIFTFQFITIVIMVVLLKITWYPKAHNYSVFTHADWSVLLMFLIVYICSTITFCFAVSVFFTKANTAAAVAGLLWFLLYCPYLFLQNQYESLSLTSKLLISLGSNTAMAYGFQVILMYEGSGDGIQWNNIWKPNNPADTLTLGFIILMLIIDSLICLLIALYVEAILPGEYGVPKPWYFPLVSKCCTKKRKDSQILVDPTTTALEKDKFEQDPKKLNEGIRIKNLSKVFKKKVVVKNLFLNIYQDQITVLLGHNGCGKTTTMYMLTGMIPPSSGTAVVAGYDIRQEIASVRGQLGFCPQHNILFNDLTVREHIYFFGRLKGVKKKDVNSEIDNYIQLLELEDKRNTKSENLSGGMKRKLSMAIALCGNSSVVLLDEPTAGVDPSARRDLWDLLQNQKKGRTILLTTHFMDEADLLGDRIAIMASGNLSCCGSSFFLKKKFGLGYRLIIEKSKECEPKKITQLFKKYIPETEVYSLAGSELSYVFPEAKSKIFEDMLQELEAKSGELGVLSYGISSTSLEEVFMKTGTCEEEISEEKASEQKCIRFCKSLSKCGGRRIKTENDAILTGFPLLTNQFVAMIMKRMLSNLRTWVIHLVQVIIPVVFLVIAIAISKNMSKTGNLPKLDLTLKPYHQPITLIEDKARNDISKTYYEVIKGHRIQNVTSIKDFMIDKSKKSQSNVKLQYIIGASFNMQKNVNISREITVITAWFNNNPYHAAPLSLGLVLDTIYKILLGQDHSITFANHPFHYTPETKIQQMLRGNSLGFQLAFNLGFSMAFVSSCYVLFYVRERVSQSKHLQLMSGARVYLFWITSYLCDLSTFVILVLIVIMTLACFQEDGFRSIADLGRIFLIFVYFCFAILPLLYLASFLFAIPSSGYTRMTLFSIVTGVTLLLVVQILSLPGLELKSIADGLHLGFLIFPHYSLSSGVRDSYLTYSTHKFCKFFVEACGKHHLGFSQADCRYFLCNNASEILREYCCATNFLFFDLKSPGIGKNLLYSFLEGIILFSLLLMFEYQVPSIIVYKLRKRRILYPQSGRDEDKDVFEEKRKIRETPLARLQRENVLIIKDLTKYYGKFLAVNGLNGAGKTSTFKMLTGDVKISYGNAWVNKYSIRTQMEYVRKYIGYCPQFDALLDNLTVKETLTMFALLRGIPFYGCHAVTEALAQDFGFTQHLNKQIKQLSGGNKRKVSTAVSLVGDPPVIYLDEPTAGMDPMAKRFLWNALCKVRDAGKCLVFTSHSMEECEALCTRLAIMVNGNFKCLGSAQHLKSKFAEGYTLTIKMKKDMKNLKAETEKVERFIAENFPRAKQEEKHEELLVYSIHDRVISCSKMFKNLEKAKTQLQIEDYALAQSSLEQVFLSLTKYQS